MERIWHLYLTFIYDNYIWHSYLTFIFDIYIWRFYLTLISDIYIWHLYLTFIFNIAPYLWHLYLTIHFSRYVQFITWNMYGPKFKSVLIYIRIAKPFVLPLQIFATITNKITFSQNSNETRRTWGRLPAPVVAYSGRKTITNAFCSSFW